MAGAQRDAASDRLGHRLARDQPATDHRRPRADGRQHGEGRLRAHAVTRLHIVDTGNPDGPPIVWLGSLGSSTAMWDPQIAEFADRHQCLLIDHPGHGSSPPPHRPLTIDSLGADVLATLDDADIDHAHVVGLSLGAMIAMALATNHPERIDRLALLCTSAYFGPPDGWIDRAALVRAEGMASVANATVERWITPTYAAAHPDEVATLVAMLMSTDPEGYAACCEAIAPMDQRPTLPK